MFTFFLIQERRWTALWASVFMHSFEYIDIKKPCLYKNCIKQPICETLKQIRCLHQSRCIIRIYIHAYTCTGIHAEEGHRHLTCLSLYWNGVENRIWQVAVNGFLNVSHPSVLHVTENIHDRNTSTNKCNGWHEWQAMSTLITQSIWAMRLLCPFFSWLDLTILPLKPNHCGVSC